MQSLRRLWSTCLLAVGTLVASPVVAKPSATPDVQLESSAQPGERAPSERRAAARAKSGGEAAPADAAPASKGPAAKPSPKKGAGKKAAEPRATSSRSGGATSKKGTSSGSKDPAGKGSGSKSSKSDKTKGKGSDAVASKSKGSSKPKKGHDKSAKKTKSSSASRSADTPRGSRPREGSRSKSAKKVRVAPGDRGPVTKPEAPSKKPDAGKGGKERGRSIGAPNAGRLSGGKKLEPSKTIRMAPGAQRWALPELVGALKRVAATMVRWHKSPPMFLGDLSAEHGGKLGPHRSHQSGRDVDIAFFATDSKGRPVQMTRFVAFDGKGRARDGSGLKFDDKRNWAMVRAFIEDRKIRVRYMFITQELEDRLIEYAKKHRAKSSVVARAAEVMQSPADVDLHDEHIHLRIDCPAHSRDVCVAESISSRGHEVPTASSAQPDATSESMGAAASTLADDGPTQPPSAAPSPIGAPSTEGVPATVGLSPSDI